MQLHINYETCPEADIDCIVDDRLVKDGEFAGTGLVPDEPSSLKDAFKIDKRLKLSATKKGDYELHINGRCRLVDIPSEVEDYTVSGRSPLKWAIEVLCVSTKKLNETGIKDDPNFWHAWSFDSFELVRHLRRLIYLSLKSREIINGLPPIFRRG